MTIQIHIDNLIEKKAHTDGLYAIAYAILQHAEATREGLTNEVHRTDHPLFGDTLSGVAEGLDGIGNSIETMAENIQNIAAMLDVHSCGKPSKT